MDLSERFPTVWQTLIRAYVKDSRITVRPGAHFHMGGIQTDLSGQTSLPGLFAIGECACTGVHGANRLASNSLLECLVMGKQVAGSLPGITPSSSSPRVVSVGQKVFSSDTNKIKRMLTQHVGVLRDGQLNELIHEFPIQKLKLMDYGHETIDRLHSYTAAALILHAAAHRKESRGAHFRMDIPLPQTDWEGCTLPVKNGHFEREKRPSIPTEKGVLL